ncbi:MAG: ADP-ribosylation factor-like protein [Candidatus Electronema sp. VV]
MGRLLRASPPPTASNAAASATLKRPEGKIRLNVWDLGGQQFMRSTHQLFFTERTLYVLVTTARRERRELNHWLKLVHELAADAPVLVVINKIDLDDHDIDREPLRRAIIRTSKVLSAPPALTARQMARCRALPRSTPSRSWKRQFTALSATGS